MRAGISIRSADDEAHQGGTGVYLLGGSESSPKVLELWHRYGHLVVLVSSLPSPPLRVRPIHISLISPFSCLIRRPFRRAVCAALLAVL